MANFFVSIVRKIALHRNASSVPTRILPMAQVRKAAVFLDATTSDADVVKKAVQAYFAKLNIPVLFIAPMYYDISPFGWMKRNRDVESWNEDMFISLAPAGNFTAEYAARCSRAVFKVGREQLKGDVFDIVITDPENQLPRQPQVFKVVQDFLDRIQ